MAVIACQLDRSAWEGGADQLADPVQAIRPRVVVSNTKDGFPKRHPANTGAAIAQNPGIEFGVRKEVTVGRSRTRHKAMRVPDKILRATIRRKQCDEWLRPASVAV